LPITKGIVSSSNTRASSITVPISISLSGPWKKNDIDLSPHLKEFDLLFRQGQKSDIDLSPHLKEFDLLFRQGQKSDIDLRPPSCTAIPEI